MNKSDNNEIDKNKREKHGMSHLPAYKRWQNIKRRCFKENSQDYEFYGERGISMCERWKNSFEAFYQDTGEPPKGMTLDRIDNNGDYEPGNVRWITIQQQQLNKRGLSNHPGVFKYYNKKYKYWLWNARLIHNKKLVLNKYSKDLQEMIKARKEAEIKYGIQ